MAQVTPWAFPITVEDTTIPDVIDDVAVHAETLNPNRSNDLDDNMDGKTRKALSRNNSSFATLYETGKYSDLTLVCERQSFKVHKAVLCTQSAVLAAACDGQFEEAKSGIIEVEISDAQTVKDMLSLLYTGDYEPEITPIAEDGMYIDGQQVDDVILEPSKRDKLQYQERQSNLRHERMMRASRLWILADYYQIPDLMTFTQEIFTTVCESHPIFDYVELATQVFDNMPEGATAFRNAIIINVLSQRIDITDVDLEAMLSVPQTFLLAFAIALAEDNDRRYETLREETLVKVSKLEKELAGVKSACAAHENAAESFKRTLSRAAQRSFEGCEYCAGNPPLYLQSQTPHSQYQTQSISPYVLACKTCAVNISLD